MSKRRLVITAVLSGSSQSEVARKYGVSHGWISRLMAQYRAQGQAVFQPASRAPRSHPNATNPQTVELILRLRRELAGQGLDAGADTVRWHLKQHHHLRVSRATIHRILVRAAAVSPAPQKRPKSSYIRFEAEQPNETWQSDFTHYRLTHPDGRPGADVEIITWLDDHSRYALHLSAHRRITAPIVHATFVETAAKYGNPASTHPTTCGKVETVPADAEELAARPTGPAGHHRRAAGPARGVPPRVQPPPAAPVPQAPRHPGRRVHHRT